MSHAPPSPSIRVRPPPGPVVAELSPPGSKSLTNRALILAALADGSSTLRGCLDSEDTRAMLAAIARFGLPYTLADDATTVTLTGNAGPPNQLADPAQPIDVATAGTAARFLTAVLAAAPITTLVDGSPRMRERPMEGLLKALREQGATILCHGADDLLPFTITGARLRGGEIRLPRPPSSQFISALILAAALASTMKRSRASLSSVVTNLIATGRSSTRSCARYTCPIVPLPSRRTSRYSSNSCGGSHESSRAMLGRPRREDSRAAPPVRRAGRKRPRRSPIAPRSRRRSRPTAAVSAAPPSLTTPSPPQCAGHAASSDGRAAGHPHLPAD